MNRFRLILLAIAAIVILPLRAQTTTVKWERQVHDFGAFDEDMGKVTCRFRFVNTGDIPLSIISARATCGCTMPSYSKRPVEPGDTGYVEVSYNPTGRPGHFSKKIYIETNTMPKKATLIVEGVVIGSTNTLRSRFPVEAGPLRLKTSVIPFGTVNKGKTKACFIEIYNTSGDTLRPYFRELPPYIAATIKGGAVPPGDYAAYSMTLDSGTTPEYGLLTDSLTFVPDKSMENESIAMSYVAMLTEDFSRLTPGQRKNAPIVSVVPDAVDCGIITPETGEIVRTLTIKNMGDKDPLLIRRIYTTDPGIEISYNDNPLKKGKSTTVTLRINPAAYTSDMLDARISVITNAPDHPVIPIRIVGEIRH